jgi:dsDNA-specific endonuclease/ATPase MutS2
MMAKEKRPRWWQILLGRGDKSSPVEDEIPEIPELFELPITDVIDLHSFAPKEISAIVREYLFQARERGIKHVRIIHGRGIGVQREIVRKILQESPYVIVFRDAPPEAGGWGATIAELAIDN